MRITIETDWLTIIVDLPTNRAILIGKLCGCYETTVPELIALLDRVAKAKAA